MVLSRQMRNALNATAPEKCHGMVDCDRHGPVGSVGSGLRRGVIARDSHRSRRLAACLLGASVVPAFTPRPARAQAPWLRLRSVLAHAQRKLGGALGGAEWARSP